MSMKIPGSQDDYHFLGHGYNARTGKFIKVQLFNEKPSADYGSAGVNAHPSTKIYYEDATSKKSLGSLMDISGEVEVTISSLGLNVKGSCAYLSDTKNYYDSQYVKVAVEYIHRTEQILDLGPQDVSECGLAKLIELGATHVVQAINYGASGLLEFESRVTEESADNSIGGTFEMNLDLDLVSISASVKAKVADGKQFDNRNVTINYTGNFP